LKLSPLKGRGRQRAQELAETYLQIAQAHQGRTRGDFDEACRYVVSNPRERRLALGFKKLVDDLCQFETVEGTDFRELRRDVFLAAARNRRDLGPHDVFDRAALLEEVAQQRNRGETPEELLRGLYADLREAQRLTEVPRLSPTRLVERYEMAQAQAVLLRATRVVAHLRCDSPAMYRYVFGKLKFRRLLYRIEPASAGGYRVTIDGPHSLFSSVTKYGLQLALMLPVFQQCDQWRLEADLLWGKDRRPLLFRLSPRTLAGYGGELAPVRGGEGSAGGASPDVEALIEQFSQLETSWVVQRAQEILQLPGLGICVPDLEFHQADTGEVVYLEVLGFWSRDAVWKRVELVQAGLPQRVIFAVPQKLRVSEQVLDPDLPGSLYVYKTKMSAKEIARRLDIDTPHTE
jgi:predicted nuclease of restriction endonuclease-like RecB superfamily